MAEMKKIKGMGFFIPIKLLEFMQCHERDADQGLQKLCAMPIMLVISNNNFAEIDKIRNRESGKWPFV